MSEHYIGLMSGTSMDAIDAALIDLSDQVPILCNHHSIPIPTELRTRLIAIAQGENTTVAHIGELDVRMGHLFADAALALLQQSKIAAKTVRAIGSHGQTIYHRPAGPFPTSMQIGDPNIIAERAGITTVADFRRRDMAAGGQGAPLVPAFHARVFHNHSEDRVVVNIGGIANISILPHDTRPLVTGFDTGPGNVLMDSWAALHLHTAMDMGGRWASTGKVHEPLLKSLLRDPYFAEVPPKSTGREYFHRPWLEQALMTLGISVSPPDIQSTLCEFSAITIAEAIEQYAPATNQVLVCGGGVHNDTLMQRLQTRLANRSLASTAAYGVDPDWVEAMAFAWLAKQTLAGLAGNLPTVTGARHAAVLGGIYQSREKGTAQREKKEGF